MKVVVACAQDISVNLLEAAAANDIGIKLMVMMMMITINANEDIKVDCIAVVGRFLNNGRYAVSTYYHNHNHTGRT